MDRAANAFTGAEIDRAADGRRRDGDWVRAQLADEHARAVVAGDSGLRAEGARLELVPLGEAGPVDEAVLLGLDADGPLYAMDEDPPAQPVTRPRFVAAGGRRGEPVPGAPGRLALREAASTLPPAEAGLAAYATALLNWHRSHRHCANCGSATEYGEAGLTRVCPACGIEHHPRTDPVVIMLVTAEDGLLLGRQRAWPEGRYSALAGFVGPGESLEEAVAREVEEEAGVRIGAPEYVSSQPWPFPASLMLGFVAPWIEGEPGGADDELQDVRWFGRAEVAAAAETDVDLWEPRADGDDGLLLPPRTAIARRLVEGWLAATA